MKQRRKHELRHEDINLSFKSANDSAGPSSLVNTFCSQNHRTRGLKGALAISRSNLPVQIRRWSPTGGSVSAKVTHLMWGWARPLASSYSKMLPENLALLTH